MMKCVFVFVLLHLCSSVDFNQSSEIITYLRKLNTDLHQKKVNFTSRTVLVPGDNMKKHPTTCEGVGIRELRNLLNNVMAHEDAQANLLNLQGILNNLSPHEENDDSCMMTSKKPYKKAFTLYMEFFQRLNSKKK